MSLDTLESVGGGKVIALNDTGEAALLVGDDGNDGIALFIETAFEEGGSIEDSDVEVAVGTDYFEAAVNFVDNVREDGFVEGGKIFLIGENDVGEFFSVEGSVLVENNAGKFEDEIAKAVFVGIGNVAGHLIGVDDDIAVFAEDFRYSRFTGTGLTGKSDDSESFHRCPSFRCKKIRLKGDLSESGSAKESVVDGKTDTVEGGFTGKNGTGAALVESTERFKEVVRHGERIVLGSERNSLFGRDIGDIFVKAKSKTVGVGIDEGNEILAGSIDNGYFGVWGVVLVFHTWGSGDLVFFEGPQNCGGYIDGSENGFKLSGTYGSRSENAGTGSDEGNDGGFNSELAVEGLQNDVYSSAELLFTVLCTGDARSARYVCARSRDRTSRRPDNSACDLVFGHPDSNGIESCRDVLGHNRGFF